MNGIEFRLCLGTGSSSSFLQDVLAFHLYPKEVSRSFKLALQGVLDLVTEAWWGVFVASFFSLSFLGWRECWERSATFLMRLEDRTQARLSLQRRAEPAKVIIQSQLCPAAWPKRIKTIYFGPDKHGIPRTCLRVLIWPELELRQFRHIHACPPLILLEWD
jgi:hypothetical protein